VFAGSAALIWVIAGAGSGRVVCHVTVSRGGSLFGPVRAGFGSFGCLDDRSFCLLSLQIQHLGLIMSIYAKTSSPHFNSRQHEGEA